MRLNKKSQQEIAGFVLIVAVVIVAGVVLLSLTIKKGEPSAQNSVEISNFLESVMYYTTDCASSFISQYRNFQELVQSCYKNENCLNGKSSCDTLNLTLNKILNENLLVSEESSNKAYKIFIYSKDQNLDIQKSNILSLTQGVFSNCSSRVGASQSISVSSISSEIINIELEVCKG